MNMNSLERIVPDLASSGNPFDQASLDLHIERYSFAIQNGEPGRILDIACGTGYGAYQIMRSKKYLRSHVTAVDISESAIEYGKKRYAHPSIDFVCADALKFTCNTFFDTIVSLETIEHLREPFKYCRKLYSLLKENGVLIISAPVTPSSDGNPNHLSDFTSKGFKKLFTDMGFTLVNQMLQIQPYTIKQLLNSENKRFSQTRHHLVKYYLKNPEIFCARISSLFRDGLNNKYLVLSLRK